MGAVGTNCKPNKLYHWVRVAAGREPSPSEAAVDSQSVYLYCDDTYYG